MNNLLFNCDDSYEETMSFLASVPYKSKSLGNEPQHGP